MTRRVVLRSLVVALALLMQGQALPSAPLPAAATQPDRSAPAASQDGTEVYFSPGGGCTQAVVAQIQAARRSIHVQAYSFTSVPIAKAILEAHRRGVAVTVVLDASQRTASYSSATFFANGGVPVYIYARHAIAHSKNML